MFDGWGAKMPFVWAALLYLCTATFCWHTAIRNGVRTKPRAVFELFYHRCAKNDHFTKTGSGQA
jgi:hypothetical protein